MRRLAYAIARSSACVDQVLHREVSCHDSSRFEGTTAGAARPGSGRVTIELAVDAAGLALSRFTVSPAVAGQLDTLRTGPTPTALKPPS